VSRIKSLATIVRVLLCDAGVLICRRYVFVRSQIFCDFLRAAIGTFVDM